MRMDPDDLTLAEDPTAPEDVPDREPGGTQPSDSEAPADAATPIGAVEATEADVVEQRLAVPVDDDEYRQ